MWAFLFDFSRVPYLPMICWSDSGRVRQCLSHSVQPFDWTHGRSLKDGRSAKLLWSSLGLLVDALILWWHSFVVSAVRNSCALPIGLSICGTNRIEVFHTLICKRRNKKNKGRLIRMTTCLCSSWTQHNRDNRVRASPPNIRHTSMMYMTLMYIRIIAEVSST